MNYSIFRFTLNMHNHRSQASVAAFRGDTAIRLHITITDGGNAYYIEDGCYAILSGTKADGHKLSNECVILNNTTIQYDFTEQTTSCVGVTNCEISLYGRDGQLLTAPKFIIVVEDREVRDDDFIESESESIALDNIYKSENERREAETERKERFEALTSCKVISEPVPTLNTFKEGVFSVIINNETEGLPTTFSEGQSISGLLYATVGGSYVFHRLYLFDKGIYIRKGYEYEDEDKNKVLGWGDWTKATDDEGGSGDTNLPLISGSASGSLQQRSYESNGKTVLGAIASGEGSVALGGQRFDKAGESIESAPQTTVEGKQSFAAGAGILIENDWSVGFGKDNTLRQRHAFAMGSDNIAGMTYEEYCANPNVDYFKKNEEDYKKSYSIATVFGNNNTAKGKSAFVAGGSYNEADGFNSHASGMYTRASGNYASSNGYETRATERAAFTTGEGTEASAMYSFASGRGTRATRAAQTAIGQYNAVDNFALFVVGNGTSSTPSNAFAIHDDGTIVNKDFSSLKTRMMNAETKINEVEGRLVTHIVDDSDAYAKIVPDNVQSKAILNRVGGKTVVKDDSLVPTKVTGIINGVSNQIGLPWENLKAPGDYKYSNGLDWYVESGDALVAYGNFNGSIASVTLGTVTLAPGKYLLSGCPAGAHQQTYGFQLTIGIDREYVVENKYIETDEYFNTPITIKAYVRGGITVNGLTFKPELRKINSRYSIPTAIQESSAYGKGVGDYYSYIDFDKKKLIEAKFIDTNIGSSNWNKIGENKYYKKYSDMLLLNGELNIGIEDYNTPYPAISTKYEVISEHDIDQGVPGMCFGAEGITVIDKEYSHEGEFTTSLIAKPVYISVATRTFSEKDISDDLTDYPDYKIIDVSSGGEIVAENEDKNPIPWTVTYAKT